MDFHAPFSFSSLFRTPLLFSSHNVRYLFPNSLHSLCTHFILLPFRLITPRGEENKLRSLIKPTRERGECHLETRYSYFGPRRKGASKSWRKASFGTNDRIDQCLKVTSLPDFVKELFWNDRAWNGKFGRTFTLKIEQVGRRDRERGPMVLSGLQSVQFLYL